MTILNKVLLLLFLSIFVFASNVQASTISEESNHGESLELVLSEILKNQNVDKIQNIDCKNVSDEDFERLGDAVMEQQHPGEAHERMDEMMGGEGSDSLSQVHINMGANYLGCNVSYKSGFMMGGGMMGLGRNYSENSLDHMNFYYSNNSFLKLSTWFLLTTFLLSGTYFFIKKSSKK